MAGKTIPAAEARKRLEATESSLGAYKSFLRMAGIETRALRQQINNLIYELDSLGVKRTYEPPKVNLFGDGEYESLLVKYVALLGENEALKNTVLQMPVAKAEISQPTKQENVELQKAYATLIDERDQLADKVKIEKDKRAKAGRRPHIKPEMIEKINKLHYQGLTQMKIAEEVGYSVFTVNRVINGFIN